MDAFDPESPLFLMVGPLTGTLASGAGRVEVLGIAPQQHPPVFSRSGMGGHWGAECKYAGYDGIVVTGQAAQPVYLWVQDESVEIREAGDLWGKGTFGTTRALRAVRLLRRLLPETDALHRLAPLLRLRRLLPEALLHSPANLLAGVVLVRRAGFHPHVALCTFRISPW